MKKFLNYRPIVFAAIALIVGIFVSTLFFAADISVCMFWIILGIFAFIMLVSIFGWIVYRSDFDLKMIFKRVAAFMIAVLVGVGSVSLASLNVENHGVVAGTYNISARVAAMPAKSSSTDNYTLVLDSMNAESDDAKFSVNGKVKMYVYAEFLSDDNLVIGDRIAFRAHIYSEKMDSAAAKRNNFSNLSDGIFTRGTIYSDIVKIGDAEVSIFEKLKIKSSEFLSSSMSESAAGIAFGMMFGDTSMMDVDVTEDYRLAGISHLLAVSGLHVGFVVTLVVGLLSLLKVNDKVTFVIVVSVLFLYLIMCNFSLSMVRAFIMTVCMLFAKCRKKSYDSLSALFFALILILLISPLSLFDVGLRMSFAAVLGILLLSKTFSRVFSKIMFKPFAESLALSLSASIGIAIVTIGVFEKITVLSVFTNMVVIPIASVAYMFLFVALMISLIFPAAAPMLIGFEYLMVPVNGMAAAAASISINNISVRAASGYEVMLFGGIFVSSDYFFARARYRIPVAIMFFALGMLIMVL